MKILKRYANDLERTRIADKHLKEALNCLRRLSNADHFYSLIADLRKVLSRVNEIHTGLLPRKPGDEKSTGKAR